MSFLKKIWPQSWQSRGARSCQDVPTGSSMAVPVVVHDPSHSRLLPCAGCRSLGVSAPRKHFCCRDASVHCLWMHISWISWVQAWGSRILPKPTESMEKKGLSRSPYVMTAHSPESCILAGWFICFLLWLSAPSLHVDNRKVEKAI